MQSSLSVKVWRVQSAILELYRYAPGPQGVVPTHCHEEYQFALCVDFPGEYRYRGSTYPTPVGSLSVLHPGEPHSARDPVERSRAATFRMIYLQPSAG